MAALAAAVRPFAGGVLPRRAAPAPSDASERAPGKMKPRRVVAPSRDSSACLAGVEELCVPGQNQKRKMMTCNRNNAENAAAADTDTKVLTAGGGGMPARELLQKRLACELDVLRGLLKKAELISRRGARNGGAPAAGKKERFLASNSKQRSEPIVDGGGNAPPSVMKRRKISALVEQNKKQKQVQLPPLMSAEERSQLAGRLSSLSGEVPGHIVEFLLKHSGDVDADGEIEIDIDSVEDSVLFELKAQLDKFAEESRDDKVAEESKDDKLVDESKGEVVLEQEKQEYADICGGLSRIIETGSKPSSSSSCDSDTKAPQQSSKANKVQDAQPATPKPVYMPGLLYRAKVRRELLEMERAALPDERIHPRDLQRLGIGEYGHPSLMRQLGLFLKADDA